MYYLTLYDTRKVVALDKLSMKGWILFFLRNEHVQYSKSLIHKKMWQNSVVFHLNIFLENSMIKSSYW